MTRMAIELCNPVQDHLAGYIRENLRHRPKMLEENAFAGKALALCGAGPSLRSQTITGVDEVWACNSALPYLAWTGQRVTAGIGIDQTRALQAEWRNPPAVPCYIASSCDPSLAAYLESFGNDVFWFHNYVGCADEMELYKQWPMPACMVQMGTTVVPRVVHLAQWMGFERIDIYGADCAFGADDLAHANGESANDAYRNHLVLEGDIDGRTWRTRADMLMGAVELVRYVRKSAGRIRLMGDTLPVALLGKSDEFLKDVCKRVDPGEPPPTDNTLTEAA